MPKKLNIYATEDDQHTIEEIQTIKPHWKNVNMIYREGLHLLLQSLQQPVNLPSQQLYQSTQQPRFIKEDETLKP